MSRNIYQLSFKASCDSSYRIYMVWSLKMILISLMIVNMVTADKLFITDLQDRAIYVGDNNGPDFFSSSSRRLDVTGVWTPVGIDYDYRNEMLYWTDVRGRTISRAKLDGSEQEILVQDLQGVSYPEGIALDLEEDRMIWTDTNLSRIESSNLDGSNLINIINTGLYFPRSIVLSQKRKMLYWTELGDETSIMAKIEMSNKWGIGRRAIVTENIGQPNGIALDSQDLTCPDPEQCVGQSTCQLISYQTPSCTCLPGYTGSSCDEVITCPPPYDVDPETHFEVFRSTYYNDETLTEVCDNGHDRRTLVCNGYTGDWYTTTSIDCNTPQVSGLPQTAIIVIVCCGSLVAFLLAAFCFRSFKN